MREFFLEYVGDVIAGAVVATFIVAGIFSALRLTLGF